MLLATSIATVVSSVSGCQSICGNVNAKPFTGSDYQYSWTDDPAEHRLQVRVLSTSKRQLCVGYQTWPKSGVMSTNEGPSVGVYLIVEGHVYAYEDTRHWAFCAELACYRPLKRGESVEGFLSYEGFGLSPNEYKKSKELKYKPQPFWCE